jgi:hypothetical protein
MITWFNRGLLAVRDYALNTIIVMAQLGGHLGALSPDGRRRGH